MSQGSALHSRLKGGWRFRSCRPAKGSWDLEAGPDRGGVLVLFVLLVAVVLKPWAALYDEANGRSIDGLWAVKNFGPASVM